MPNVLLGMDLGGTKLDFLLSDQDGRFLHEKQFPSPFRKTAKMTAVGEAEVLIDTLLTDIPRQDRVAAYIAECETRFLKEARKAAGRYDISGKGVSLCGKTWQEQGKIMVTGGNTPMRFAAHPDQSGSGIAVMDVNGDGILRAANDGTAAATAQGIHFQVVQGIDPGKTAGLTRNSQMLVPALHVEPTPIDTPARFGALALVVPESRYEAWAARMTRGHTGKHSAGTPKGRS